VSPAAPHRALRQWARTTHPLERVHHTLRQRVSRLLRAAVSCSKTLVKPIGAMHMCIGHEHLTRAAASREHDMECTTVPIAQGSASGLSCPRKRHRPRHGLHGRKPAMRRGEAAMRDHRRRLERLEYAHLRRLAAKESERYGFTADDVLAECRRVFALPDDQQREVLHRLYKDLSQAEAAELDAIRHRDAAILRRQR
jgi:hypothetical protein